MRNLDLLFPDRQRRPYYIVAPAYMRVSAGIKVLHQLCHLLNLRGQSAFMITSKVNADLATPVLSEQIVDQHFEGKRTPIIIYPETLHGNPLTGKCVVRYLLNLPGLLGGPLEFPPDDLLIWYSKDYRQIADGIGPILSIPATDARFFCPPPPGTERQGSCFYAGKFREYCGDPLSEVTKNSVEILRLGAGIQTQEQILGMFQRAEVFFCYESSALILEANLCGCPAVLIPNKHMDKLITCEPLGKAGIAWGTGQDELEHARRTVGELPRRYERWVDQAFEQLDEFIGLSQRKAFQTAYTEKIRLVNPFAPVPEPTSENQRPENGVKQALRRIVPQSIRRVIRKAINAAH